VPHDHPQNGFRLGAKRQANGDLAATFAEVKARSP
jgi:hypothetical protein